MTDVYTPTERSRVMASVKSRDTKPEITVRKLLHGMGYRFRLHRKDLPGRPDIVLPRHRKVILVHGCFWHGHPDCKHSGRPTTNREFWDKKLDRNLERDAKALSDLETAGWSALVVWECQTRETEALRRVLATFLTAPVSGTP